MLNLILIWILIIFQVFDVWSTVVVIDAGGHEINKIMKWFMDRVGVFNGIVLSKTFLIPLVLTVWYFPDSVVVTIVLTLLDLYYGYFMLRNWWVIDDLL